mgnify:CR=1 FL=1
MIYDINKEFKEKKDELDTYKNTTVQDLWLRELDEFEKYYDKTFLLKNKYLLIDKVNNISSWSFYKIDKYLPELDKLYIPVYKNIYHDYFLFNELFTKSNLLFDNIS